MKHCCDEMNFFLDEKKVKINYNSSHRKYYIYASNSAIQLINYCPWCGSKLPSALSEKWYNELEAKGFEDPFEDEIPNEYKTDAWWKGRF